VSTIASSAALCVEGASVSDPVAAPVMSEVLTALATVFEGVQGVPLPCAWGMFAGEALDRGADCGTDPATGQECKGLAWVRLVNVYPSVNFPDEWVRPYRGDLSYAVVLEVGVVRPATRLTQVDNETVVPTMDEETASAALEVTDAAIVRHALVTEFGEDGDRGVVLGILTPFGPQGDVVGTTTLVTVQVP
jgi:hypothetical protein